MRQAVTGDSYTDWMASSGEKPTEEAEMGGFRVFRVGVMQIEPQ